MKRDTLRPKKRSLFAQGSFHRGKHRYVVMLRCKFQYLALFQARVDSFWARETDYSAVFDLKKLCKSMDALVRL